MSGTRRRIFGAACLAALLAAGCGKPVLRIADASLGDYYSPEEFKKLREEQRLEYCQELVEQDSIYREEIAEANLAAERYARRAAGTRAAADSLSRAADSLAALVATRGAAPPRGAVGGSGSGRAATVTVRAGDSLWRISARVGVLGEGRRWPRLYEANRDRIRDADRIYPGQELVVPR
ncbi:MAG TPA: LysM peptidoglycan-binding domain-containing protein [Candidatus Eisenbacteria bacterium]